MPLVQIPQARWHNAPPQGAQEPVGPFSPSSIAGLKVWLKESGLAGADADPITTWTNDGSAGSPTQATSSKRPTKRTAIVNGHAVCRFDGTDDVLNFPAEVSLSDFTLFLVFQTTGDNVLAGSYTQNDQIVRIGQGGTALQVSCHEAAGVDQLASLFTTARTSWSYMAVGRAGTTLSWWEKGVARGSATVTFAMLFGAVGALGAPAALFTNGDIAEVIAYDTALSIADRQAVEGYLAARFAL